MKTQKYHIKRLPVFIALALGITTTASTLAQNQMAMVTPHQGHDMGQHNHTPKELPENSLVPQLSLVITADAMSGYNLELITKDFDLMPPQLSTEEGNKENNASEKSTAQGHAHLYINGVKIQRLYGNHVHLPSTLFNGGINQISVSLNSHQHETWTKNNISVLATLFINTDQNPVLQHSFAAFPVK